jgi:nucleotide-binding universal stress UspA family protein
MPYRRILCATDFSVDAGAALNRAVMVAQEHGASLEVLHVLAHESLDALRQWVPEPLAFGERLTGALRTELESCAAAAAARAGVRIETRVVVGDVTQSILERAGSADLLAIGAHGSNPLKDFMIGTTAERLAGQCTTPILVVRVTPERAYSNVLVAVDLLPGSDKAMATALEFAGGATLTAAHVFDVPFEGMLARAGVGQPVIDEHRLRAHQAALEKIAELSRSVSGEADRFLALVERGHAAATLVDQQRRTRADLVVIRKRVRSLVEALLLGSVTRHVLSDVASDVLLLTQPAR